jgi:molybdenum cofactor cytidylyltransferase
VTGNVISVVLAAGAGTRFGGPKQLAILEGRPLLEHALAAAQASCSQGTVVVLGARAAEVEAGVEFGDALVVRCSDWERGQTVSLRTGLAALPSEAEAALITLGDEPYVPPAAATRLLDARRPGVLALRATYGGRPGHPVLIERELFERLSRDPDDRSPAQILKEAGVMPVPCDDLGDPADVDTTAQLAELAAKVAARPRSDLPGNGE